MLVVYGQQTLFAALFICFNLTKPPPFINTPTATLRKKHNAPVFARSKATKQSTRPCLCEKHSDEAILYLHVFARSKATKQSTRSCLCEKHSDEAILYLHVFARSIATKQSIVHLFKNRLLRYARKDVGQCQGR